MSELIAAYRQKHPQYAEIDDGTLVAAIYKKHYADKMDEQTFLGKVFPRPDIPAAVAAAQAGAVDDMGVGGRLAAGMGKGAADIGYGLGQAVGLVSQDDIKAKQQRDAPLMQTGAGQVGDVLGKVAVAAPTFFVPGANTVTGAALTGAGIGFAEPVAEGDVVGGKIMNTAVGAALGKLGHQGGEYLGRKLVERSASKAAALAASKAQGTVKDATTKEAQSIGYVVPPTHANPSVLNRTMEGIAGKLTTAQRAAEKNQAVTDNLARSALGLRPTDPITPELLSSIRQQAGAAYEAIKQAPIVVKSDARYVSDLRGVLAGSKEIAESFPDLADDGLEKLVSGVSGAEFKPGPVIELIKRFRDDAKTLFRSDSPEKVALARANQQIAGALENLLSRNLKDQPELFAAFTEARKLIAKTYSVESALNPGTGHVVASKLAAQLGRGAPLSGELRTAAKFAKAYPKAVQEVSSSMPGMSPLDVYGSAAAGAAMDSIVPFALPASRVASREVMLTKPFQNRMTTPNYTPGPVNKMLPYLGRGAAPAGRVAAPLVYAEQ